MREDALMHELKKLGKKTASQGFKKEPPEAKKITKVRSAEEEVIQLLVNHPELISSCDENLLTEERTSKIFGFLKKKSETKDIIEQLDEDGKAWYRELVLEEKEYSDPRQVLSDLAKSLKGREMESRRKKLEEEIILMHKGKIPHDIKKIELFKELTAQLKGSGK